MNKKDIEIQLETNVHIYNFITRKIEKHRPRGKKEASFTIEMSEITDYLKKFNITATQEQIVEAIDRAIKINQSAH